MYRLSKEEIDQLFDFCRKKYVHYYEVQVELVGRLAKGIEEAMEKNNTLSFNDALHEVYKGFGITGFSDIMKEKEVATLKARRRVYWQNVGKFLTTSAVIGFGLAFFIFLVIYYQALQQGVSKQLLFVVPFLGTIVYFAFAFRFRHRLRKRIVVETNRKNPRLSIVSQQGNLSSVFFYIIFLRLFYEMTFSDWSFSVPLAILVYAVIALFDWVSLTTSAQIIKQAEQQFPTETASA